MSVAQRAEIRTPATLVHHSHCNLELNGGAPAPITHPSIPFSPSTRPPKTIFGCRVILCVGRWLSAGAVVGKEKGILATILLHSLLPFPPPSFPILIPCFPPLFILYLNLPLFPSPLCFSRYVLPSLCLILFSSPSPHLLHSVSSSLLAS